MTPTAAARELPKATLAETLGVPADVVMPNVAKGVIIRRRRAAAMADRLDLDRRAVRRLQRLRHRYGDGPLLLQLPARSQAVILAPGDVQRVLDESPEPFATATPEKRAALSHFEPKNALISHGPQRAVRRRFNEQVLEHDHPVHRLGKRFVAVADEEVGLLLGEVRGGRGELGWDAFADTWFRIVRRVVFGDAARDDRELRRMIDRLRQDANWAFLKPKRRGLRRRFLERLNAHLERAEPGSLAQVVASVPKSRHTAPDHQVPQWLFAFDPAGMATFRALALLATHPEHLARAREELRTRDGGADGARLPFLRACLLESLRLWPTTPMVLRETTQRTSWENGVMPPHTGVLIYAPYFHRDDERLPHADRFAPEIWLEAADDQGNPPAEWPLIPFSGGPGICPGRNLVLLLGSNVLGGLLDDRAVELREPRLDARQLPATLNHYGLRFRLAV